LIASGGYHDYKMLAPFLSTNLSQRVNATVDVKFGLDLLANPKFADGYDAVVYDVCDDETTEANIESVLSVIRAGKPAVMVHCSILLKAGVRRKTLAWTFPSGQTITFHA